MLKIKNLLTIFAILLMFASSCTEDDSCNTVPDIDGNVYHTITIGTQTWMVDNLKTTKYNDGKSIPNITDVTAWATLETPGYCFYNNDVAYKSTNGALYNWYTVNTGNLAPSGWHVATNADWTTLNNYISEFDYNFDGPSGCYRDCDGAFGNAGHSCYWWSSSQGDACTIWSRFLDDNERNLYSFYTDMRSGSYVRCVRN